MEGSSRGIILSITPDVCLEGLSKTTRSLSQDSQSPARDLIP
jgi:hypothetical protein